MKYNCKTCGKTEHAKDFDAIVKYRKLCSKCLANENSIHMKRDTKSKTKVVYECTKCGKLNKQKVFKCRHCECKTLTLKRIAQ